MVLGLLTPVIGPAVDHHYVDRSPAHAHVFTGEDAQDHEHSLATHDHSDLSFDGSGDGTSVVSTSISSGSGLLSLDGATLEVGALDFEGNVFVLHTHDPIDLDGSVIAPLDRPPRDIS